MFSCWRRSTSFDIGCVLPVSRRQSRAAAVVAICAGRIGVGLQSLTLSAKAWIDDLRPMSEACPIIESNSFLRDPSSLSEHFLAPRSLWFDSFVRLRAICFSRVGGDIVTVSRITFLSTPRSSERIVGMRLKDVLEVAPSSIRFLIESIVADPNWAPTTDHDKLRVTVGLKIAVSEAETAPY